ncbi:hypothetical protein PG985_008324 [Apiospora marii]|uniref:uncharacterized protein n=1 Tax=Apiospora marii TaxID=335849 RepID=UPI00312E55EA
MCSSRILGRLRLKKASGRLSIGKILKDTRSLLQKTGPPATFSLFAETFEGVIKLVDAWSGYQTQDALEALVDGIYRLQQTKDVSSVINGTPNRWMVPTTRTSLLNMIMKVARYRESARILRRLAQKCPLLRRMELVLVQLGASAFGKVSVKQLEPDLASKIPQKEKKKKKNSPYSIENICRLIKTEPSQASEVYAQQMRKTLTEGKVHAEIQLLFHVEQAKPKFPPRVVCSSKDACFLCNTFIAVHGKMHTPRTHGRLYPGWRLPQIGDKDTHTKFVNHLDNLIKSDILLLSELGEKTDYPFPNESTLLTLPVSTSTLSSRATHQSATLSMRDLPPPPPPLETVEEAVVEPINDTPEPMNVSGAGPRSDGEPSATRATAVMTPTTKNSPEANDERLNREASPISSLSEVVSSMSVHDSTQPPGSVRLPETVGANGTSPFYSDGVLEVQVEYAAGVTASGGVPKLLPFSIEWLGDVEEADRAGGIQAQPIFDAESSETEISLSPQ